MENLFQNLPDNDKISFFDKFLRGPLCESWKQFLVNKGQSDSQREKSKSVQKTLDSWLIKSKDASTSKNTGKELLDQNCALSRGAYTEDDSQDSLIAEPTTENVSVDVDCSVSRRRGRRKKTYKNTDLNEVISVEKNSALSQGAYATDEPQDSLITEPTTENVSVDVDCSVSRKRDRKKKTIINTDLNEVISVEKNSALSQGAYTADEPQDSLIAEPTAENVSVDVDCSASRKRKRRNKTHKNTDRNEVISVEKNSTLSQGAYTDDESQDRLVVEPTTENVSVDVNCSVSRERKRRNKTRTITDINEVISVEKNSTLSQGTTADESQYSLVAEPTTENVSVDVPDVDCSVSRKRNRRNKTHKNTDLNEVISKEKEPNVSSILNETSEFTNEKCNLRKRTETDLSHLQKGAKSNLRQLKITESLQNIPRAIEFEKTKSVTSDELCTEENDKCDRYNSPPNERYNLRPKRKSSESPRPVKKKNRTEKIEMNAHTTHQIATTEETNTQMTDQIATTNESNTPLTDPIASTIKESNTQTTDLIATTKEPPLNVNSSSDYNYKAFCHMARKCREIGINIEDILKNENFQTALKNANDDSIFFIGSFETKTGEKVPIVHYAQSKSVLLEKLLKV